MQSDRRTLGYVLLGLHSADLHARAFAGIEPFDQSGPLPRPVATTPATCRLAWVGLVGFHLAAKTFWAPQWIWSTFEHTDNVPAGNTSPDEPEPPNFSLFNPSLAAPPLGECLDQRPGITPAALSRNFGLIGCPNEQNIDNSRPDPGNKGESIAVSCRVSADFR